MGRVAAAIARLDAAMFGPQPAAAGGVTGTVTPISSSMYRSMLSLAGYDVSSMDGPVTREDAWQVPALNNGISLLCGIAQQLPLKADKPTRDLDRFLARLDPRYPAGWTIAKTVESLIFDGCAWWHVTGRYSAGNFPAEVEWVAPHRLHVQVEPDGAVSAARLDNQPVPVADLIYFPGVSPGILTAGAQAIRAALANVKASRVYAEHPAPRVIFTDADGAESLNADDASDYLTAYMDAVRSGGTAYLAGLQATQVGWSSKELALVDARTFDGVEAARLLAIPTRYVAAPDGGGSLTYSNLADVRRDLMQVGGLATYAVPIEQRLSLLDVSPYGVKVIFDRESFASQVGVDPSTDTPTLARPSTPTPEVPAP